MNINADFENLVKILVIGDFNVGKTNFILQFAEEQFIENAMSTVVFDLKSKILKVASENIKIKYGTLQARNDTNQSLRVFFKKSKV